MWQLRGIPREMAWLRGKEAPGENVMVPMHTTHAALRRAKYLGNSFACSLPKVCMHMATVRAAGQRHALVNLAHALHADKVCNKHTEDNPVLGKGLALLKICMCTASVEAHALQMMLWAQAQEC